MVDLPSCENMQCRQQVQIEEALWRLKRTRHLKGKAKFSEITEPVQGKKGIT